MQLLLEVRDMMSFLLRSMPALLLGGLALQDAGPQLEAFWALYRFHHPSHVVFETHSGHLNRVIPWEWHADEGRGQKRSNFLVGDVESVFGMDTADNVKNDTHVLDCAECPTWCDPFNIDLAYYPDLLVALNQSHNNKHDSLLNRFLTIGMHKVMYEDQPEVLDAALTLIAQDAASIFTEGIELNGERWYFACIGQKADASWHCQTGKWLRTYHNLGSKNKIAMCDECMGGSPGLNESDFSDNAPWMQTCHISRPWSKPPPITGIPLEPCGPEGAPGKICKKDLFHMLKVGSLRNLVASAYLFTLPIRFL